MKQVLIHILVTQALIPLGPFKRTVQRWEQRHILVHFFHLRDTIITSDVELNETYFNNSSLSTSNKVKLKLKVSLHEVGHFIGLGHSTVTPAVMQLLL